MAKDVSGPIAWKKVTKAGSRLGNDVGINMNNSKTVIKKSKIHGRGLFASDVIMKGECIGVISGQKTIQNGDYVLWLSENEGLKVTCDLRFINHDDNPNACFYDTLDVVALKDIQPGEEITHNYEQEDSE